MKILITIIAIVAIASAVLLLFCCKAAGKKEKKEYIANYGNWHFESYWNEYTESWSVYQAEKTENGYEFRCHCFQDNPVRTTEDAKERVENWLELLPLIQKASADHDT